MPDEQKATYMEAAECFEMPLSRLLCQVLVEAEPTFRELVKAFKASKDPHEFMSSFQAVADQARGLLDEHEKEMGEMLKDHEKLKKT